MHTFNIRDFLPHLRYPGAAPRMKPQAVNEYNKYMLGVDHMEQQLSYYQFTHKSVRWWRKVFFWMLDVAVVNSYLLEDVGQHVCDIALPSAGTLGNTYVTCNTHVGLLLLRTNCSTYALLCATAAYAEGNTFEA